MRSDQAPAGTGVRDGVDPLLEALMWLCRHHGIGLIDCQQNTGHLAFLGGREIPRSEFLLQVEKARNQPAIPWAFDPVYWNELLPTTTPKA